MFKKNTKLMVAQLYAFKIPDPNKLVKAETSISNLGYGDAYCPLIEISPCAPESLDMRVLYCDTCRRLKASPVSPASPPMTQI